MVTDLFIQVCGKDKTIVAHGYIFDVAGAYVVYIHLYMYLNE